MEFGMLLRAFFSFIALLVLARVLGKKQISQLTFFDYVVGITIGNIVGALSIDKSQDLGAAIQGLLVWSVIPFILNWAGKQSYRFRRIINGKPTIVIEHGKILQGNLHREHMTIQNMMELLREKNVFNLSQVEFAVLETNGKLSVMKKTEDEPITPKSQGVFVVNEREPRLVVIDGNVMERTLAHMGYTREWLLGEIMKQGATRFEDVFVAQVDPKGKVYVDLWNDEIQQSEIKERPLVAATLKKAQADLEQFALQTNDEDSKQVYQQNAKTLATLIERTKAYLRD